jgi:hypothetical protein
MGLQYTRGTPFPHNLSYSDPTTSEQPEGFTDEVLNLPMSRPFLSQQAPIGAGGDRTLFGLPGRPLPSTAIATETLARMVAEEENKENETPESNSQRMSWLSRRTGSTRGGALPDARSWATLVHPNPMPRSSSHYPDEDESWVDTQASESHPDLTYRRHAFEEEDAARPSEDSYANTSVGGSTTQLSINAPVGFDPTEPIPPLPTASRTREAFPFTRNPLPTAEDVLNRRTRQAFKYLDEIHMERDVQGRTPPDETKVDRKHHDERTKWLNWLKYNFPEQFAKAVDMIAEKYGTGKGTHLAGSASRSSVFNGIKRMFGADTRLPPGTDTEQLLAGPHTGEPTSNFPSSNTIVREQSGPQTPRAGLIPPTVHSPVTSPRAALLRDRTSVIPHGGVARELPSSPYTPAIELKNLRKPRIVDRAAMSSQTEIRPLALVESTASANTGRLTDSQLAQAEPGWSTRPQASDRRSAHAVTGFGITQADGSIEHVSLLMNPGEARHMGERRMQVKLTKPWFQACRLFPVTAAWFGLGGLDFKMREMSGGLIDEMWPEAKKQSLTVWLPLGVIIYAAIGLMVALIVVALNK